MNRKLKKWLKGISIGGALSAAFFVVLCFLKVSSQVVWLTMTEVELGEVLTRERHSKSTEDIKLGEPFARLVGRLRGADAEPLWLAPDNAAQLSSITFATSSGMPCETLRLFVAAGAPKMAAAFKVLPMGDSSCTLQLSWHLADGTLGGSTTIKSDQMITLDLRTLDKEVDVLTKLTARRLDAQLGSEVLIDDQQKSECPGDHFVLAAEARVERVSLRPAGAACRSSKPSDRPALCVGYRSSSLPSVDDKSCGLIKCLGACR